MKNLLIFGGSSTGKEILEIVKEYYKSEYEEIFNVVENDFDRKSNNILFEKDLSDFVTNNNQTFFILSMTKQSIRHKCLILAQKFDLTPINIIHPNSYLTKSSTLGNGVYIAANVAISSNVKINNHVIVNYNSVVGHDSIIKDNVIINPGVVVGGNVVLNERVIIGANSFILQEKTIGADTTIDAMTYIDKNIDSRKISSNRNLNIYS